MSSYARGNQGNLRENSREMLYGSEVNRNSFSGNNNMRSSFKKAKKHVRKISIRKMIRS